MGQETECERRTNPNARLSRGFPSEIQDFMPLRT
jgi:hypothetical protein